MIKAFCSGIQKLVWWLCFLALFLGFMAGRPCSAQPNPADRTASPTNEIPESTSKLRDPEDGWLDASGFLDEAYGFVPLAMPITEPAVGYGAGGGLIFIDRNEQKPGEPFRKPNLAAVGGMATENGSWAVFGGHTGSWLEGKLETLAAVGYGSINLDFYGIGEGALNDHPARYNLEPLGGIVEGRYRIGRTPLQAGLRYSVATTKVSFDNGILPGQIHSSELDSTVAGVTPTLTYDSRNNLFTPTKGIYAQIGVGVFNEVVGSDFNFETVDLTFIAYVPLAEKLTFGMRFGAGLSFDDAPFYTRPFISLRGAAIRRYVGEHASEVELEARWQFWRRFSLVGFAGGGIAWNQFERFDNQQKIVTGGVGFRYELARRYGLHMGLDVAFGPDDPAIYVQFGSAWFRP